eukprot:TRINITY_DN102188_c0_g1_i1.p1 TRINITY_DN102188_c0_g1~~TRINITY_DN102188_c0_g1_i1.p1  ORF type:complete len:467 (+),score=100.34 TRINITY_DN102188_c0_g1_i1:100-1401(+)
MAAGGGYDSAATPATSSKIALEAPHTITSRDQVKTERDVVSHFKSFLALAKKKGQDVKLDRELHTEWLKRGLKSLPANFAGLDASRPWFVFWITHALEVFDDFDPEMWSSAVASFLSRCQDPKGGFGGGPMQLPHLAPTYAAISALMIAGCEAAYAAPNRSTLYNFLMRMKSPSGGFMMHHQGETDMRGTYCALAVASMLHMITDELIEGVPEYVSRCQTFEGGIAGEEGLEAHGGYAYCGLAALCIIGKADALDLHALLNWACKRQMQLEGGFCGRTNKLVDSCYSFWQAAIFPLLREAFRQQGQAAPPLPEDNCWFSPQPLQMYVMLACQHPSGGLRDKPGKSADFYHSCYSISGTALSMFGPGSCVAGDPSNKLHRPDPYYNIGVDKSQNKCAFFEKAAAFTDASGKEVRGTEGKGVAIAREYFLSQGAA